MANYMQGTYQVKNKEKYVGGKAPRYLSSWELQVFKYFDSNPNVLQWGAECVIVPYWSEVDQRKRRYMVDLYVKYKNRNGDVLEEIIEVKPLMQTTPPKKGGRKKKETYLREVYTWNVNQAKWKAAAEYAKKRNMKFRIITEKDIFR